LSGINNVNDPRVRKLAEEASTMIRRKTLFDNLFPEDLDEMGPATWIQAHRLCKFDDSAPQQPVLDHLTYASSKDFLWYQCEPLATAQRISLFCVKHPSLTDWHYTPRALPTTRDAGPEEEEYGAGVTQQRTFYL